MNDVLLDSNNELRFRQGDFDIGNADQQAAEHLLRAFPGHYRQFPTLGAGIDRYLNGPASKQEVERIIRQELEADDFTVQTVQATDTGFKVAASR